MFLLSFMQYDYSEFEDPIAVSDNFNKLKEEAEKIKNVSFYVIADEKTHLQLKKDGENHYYIREIKTI